MPPAARFDSGTTEPLGFIVCDLDGLHVHRETLKSSTGIDLDIYLGHFSCESNLDDIYAQMPQYSPQPSTTVHPHPWAALRRFGVEGGQTVSGGCHYALYAIWLSPETLPTKCFTRMRLEKEDVKDSRASSPPFTRHPPGFHPCYNFYCHEKATGDRYSDSGSYDNINAPPTIKRASWGEEAQVSVVAAARLACLSTDCAHWPTVQSIRG